MGVTTIFLLCPLWGHVAEVTALSDERGLVTVLSCSLSGQGAVCLAPCEAEVRRWCGEAAPRAFTNDPR